MDRIVVSSVTRALFYVALALNVAALLFQILRIGMTAVLRDWSGCSWAFSLAVLDAGAIYVLVWAEGLLRLYASTRLAQIAVLREMTQRLEQGEGVIVDMKIVPDDAAATKH